MTTVLVCRERRDWDKILKEFGVWDFGHGYEFHALSERNGEGSPVLFVVYDESGRSIMIWPGLIREISGTPLSDMTSVYGYSGPMLKDVSRRKECLQIVFDKMHEMGIVDVFSRMHPILGAGFEELSSNFIESGSVVLMDLKEQSTTLESYGAGLRYDIRKLRQLGIDVELDDKCEHLDDFRRIYSEAMSSLNADSYYFFDENYFDCIAKMRGSKVVLIFAKYESVRIGAGLFVITNGIMQYYLGGGIAKFRQLSPLKIVLERAHQLAIDAGLRYLVLGGGVGSEKDDLFRFKCRFGRTVVPFYLLKKIINTSAYVELCTVKGLEPDTMGFFPTYRAPFIDDFQ